MIGLTVFVVYLMLGEEKKLKGNIIYLKLIKNKSASKIYWPLDLEFLCHLHLTVILEMVTITKVFPRIVSLQMFSTGSMNTQKETWGEKKKLESSFFLSFDFSFNGLQNKLHPHIQMKDSQFKKDLSLI